MSDDHLRRARQLRDLVEPVASQVYFAPEAVARYEALGLSYIEGYLRSRAGALGDVGWSSVAAAFAVFEPGYIRTHFTAAADKSDRLVVLDARSAGAVDQLRRVLGAPDHSVTVVADRLRALTDGLDLAGRPLFAALTGIDWPDDPWGQLWHAADLIREHRGDSHIAAWISHLDPVEVNLLTELYWKVPLGSYIRSRAWRKPNIEAGVRRLEERGLVAGGAFTPTGKRLRAEIEVETDCNQRAIVARLGEELDTLAGPLTSWADALIEAKAYPRTPADATDWTRSKPRSR